MGQLQQIAQHHLRVRAQIILLAQLRQGARHIALHQCLEQVMDAHPVGQAQHFAHLYRRHLAAAMGDGLIQ